MWYYINKKSTYDETISFYLDLFNIIGNDISHNNLMDTYTVTRMLHKFKEGNYPKNIIFYEVITIWLLYRMFLNL